MKTGLFELLVSPNEPSSNLTVELKSLFRCHSLPVPHKTILIRRLFYRFSHNIEQARDHHNYVHNRERLTQLHI